MHSFISLLYYIFKEAVAPALVGALMGEIVLIPLWRKRRREGAPFPLLQGTAIVLLFCYLGGLAAVTLLHRTTGVSWVQTHLFRAFGEAWNAFTLQVWLNPLLNIGMFVPLGVLLPLTVRPFRKWYWTLAAGAGGSLAIETLQYILQRGSADVDDLFCNTLGAMLGYCLCMLVVCLKEKRWKRAGACAALPALSAAVLAGVFITYQLQPYGNLADASAFAADTRGTAWVLECELSDQPGPSGVYWAEPFTKESCDEFALAFAKRRGVDIEGVYFDTEYYDNTAYYSDHSTFCIIVDYNDRSYRYSDYRVHPDLRYGSEKGTATEPELRAALEELGIDVPGTAEFIDEGRGRYVFRAGRVVEGDILIDGELVCEVAKGGVLYEVDNALTASTLHSEAAVISERAAYERLRAGRFSAADMFDYYAPEDIHVTSCELQYRIDSKGFRQPVYYFTLSDDYDEALRGGSAWRAFVPARA